MAANRGAGARPNRGAVGAGGALAAQQPAVWLVSAFATGIGSYFGLSWEPNWPELCAVLLPAGLAWLSARIWWPLRWAGLVLGAAGLGLIAAKARAELQLAPVWPDGPPRVVTVVGTVLAVDYRTKGSARVLVRVAGITSSRSVPERILVTLRDRSALRMGADNPGAAALGQRVRFRARLSAPRPALRPGGYDPARKAFFERIGAYGVLLGPMQPATSDDPPAPRLTSAELFWLWAERERRGIADAIIASVPGTQGTIAAALVTGLRGEIDEETIADLRVSGLAHILAISGLHMVLMAGSVFWAVRVGLAAIPWVALVWPVKQIAAGVALFAAASYLALSGAAVSTERAFIMTGVALLAVFVGRRAISLRNVALAAGIVLARRPEALLEPGFQMSFAAATGLVAGYQAWSAWRAARAGRWDRERSERFGANRIGGAGRMGADYMAGILGSTAIASVAIAPYAAYHFHTFASFSLLANALAMPFVGLVIMPGLVVAVLLLPLGAAETPLWAVGEAIGRVTAIAAWVSDFSGAVVEAPAFPAWVLALITAGGLWLLCWQGRPRLAGLAPLILGFVAAFSEPQPAIRISPDGRMVALDCAIIAATSRSGRGASDAAHDAANGAADVQPCDGMSLSSIGKPDRFVRDAWTRASGRSPNNATDPDAQDALAQRGSTTKHSVPAGLPSASRPGWTCDTLGCVARLGPLMIMHAHARSALAECQRVDVVIAPFAVSPRACPDPILRIDGRALRRGGAHELSVQPPNTTEPPWFGRFDAAGWLTRARPAVADQGPDWAAPLAGATPPALGTRPSDERALPERLLTEQPLPKQPLAERPLASEALAVRSVRPLPGTNTTTAAPRAPRPWWPPQRSNPNGRQNAPSRGTSGR